MSGTSAKQDVGVERPVAHGRDYRVGCERRAIRPVSGLTTR
jgi:hypothetical protein